MLYSHWSLTIISLLFIRGPLVFSGLSVAASVIAMEKQFHDKAQRYASKTDLLMQISLFLQKSSALWPKFNKTSVLQAKLKAAQRRRKAGARAAQNAHLALSLLRKVGLASLV